MNKTNFLLQCLQDEAAKVIGVASNAQKFGLDEMIEPSDSDETNSYGLGRTIAEFISVIHLIDDHVGGWLESFDEDDIQEIMNEKEKEIDMYFKHILSKKTYIPIEDFPAKGGEWTTKIHCTHPSHSPPMHLYIAPGQTYEHKCPGCGQISAMSSPQMTC